jgi:HEAT repeat protein
LARDDSELVAKIMIASREGDTDSLINTLTDPRYRGIAARLLGYAGCEDAIPRIQFLLRANDPKARLGAVRALSALKSLDSFEQIVELARSDPHHNVRLWSIAAIGEIGGPGAADILVPLLGDADWDVRRAAAYALGQLAERATIEPIERAARAEPLHRRGVYRRAVKTIRASN